MLVINRVFGLVKFGIIIAVISLLSGCWWWGYALWSGPPMRAAKDCSTWTSSEVGSASKEGNRQRVKKIIQSAGPERASTIKNAMLAASACGQQVIIDDLLEEGVDFSDDGSDMPFLFRLSAAAKPEILDYILNRVDVNLNLKISPAGFTALHWIVCGDDAQYKNIRILLKHGANFNAIDSAGRTPLMVAQGCKDQSSISLFREYENGIESRKLHPHGR